MPCSAAADVLTRYKAATVGSDNTCIHVTYTAAKIHVCIYILYKNVSFKCKLFSPAAEIIACIIKYHSDCAVFFLSFSLIH